MFVDFQFFKVQLFQSILNKIIPFYTFNVFLMKFLLFTNKGISWKNCFTSGQIKSENNWPYLIIKIKNFEEKIIIQQDGKVVSNKFSYLCFDLKFLKGCRSLFPTLYITKLASSRTWAWNPSLDSKRKW